MVLKDTLVCKKVIVSQKNPRKGCSRTRILCKQRKTVSEKINMAQVVRRSGGAPVARYSAEQEPQAVEKPGLACKKTNTKQPLDVQRSNWRVGGGTCRQRGEGFRRSRGDKGKTAQQEKEQKTQKRDLGMS